MNGKDLGVVIGSVAAVMGISYARSKMSGSLAQLNRKPDSKELREQLDEKIAEMKRLDMEADRLRHSYNYIDPDESKILRKKTQEKIGRLKNEEKILERALSESLANEKVLFWTLRDPDRNFARAEIHDSPIQGAKRGSIYDLIADERIHRERAPRARFNFDALEPEEWEWAKRSRKLP